MSASRTWLAVASLLVAGCGGDNVATNLLCDYCVTDADCGGNPCFADVTGVRFCGAPCSGCPAGFSCAPLQGTTGQVTNSCFPTNQNCMTTPLPDMAGGGGGGGDGGQPPRDMSQVACTPPVGGTITSSGGTVDCLYFGYTGDTRDNGSVSSYSSALQTIINNIYKSMATKGVEFALDGGDHMEASNFSEATGNMGSYATAAAFLKKPVFMTMGNHECSQSFNAGQSCGFANAGTTDSKMSAYMNALKTISGQTSPYYRFDVMTQSGKAVFLVVADDAWNTTQQTWLTTQLIDADANAKYTFVSKHHPDGNADQTYFQDIYNLVTSHKYTLFLTGHSHEYKHQPTDHRGVVMGLGGAPWDNPNQMYWGYVTVMQCPDDKIYVNVIDQATGMVKDSFNVPPQ